MGRILARMGDIFEGSADVTVLPCSAKGTVSSATRRWLSLFGLPSPFDLDSKLGLGDISEMIPFPGSHNTTKYVVFAASVLNDFSSAEVIERIAVQLGVLTKANPEIQIIEAPLLGTGAGGLKNEVAGEAFYKGFKLSSSPASALYVFVFDAERFTLLDNIFTEMDKIAGEASQLTDSISILFLAGDPSDVSRLRLGEEFREIQEKLKLARLRDRFQLQLPQLAVRPTDISQALLDTQPQIVHFSGHGTSAGALCFENPVGATQLIQPDALAALFKQFAHQVNCVLLNACYAETQARAIAQYIDSVIGMNQAISDKAAIAFAIGFYQALGAGRTVDESFELGCVQIRLQGIPEHLTPVLVKKNTTQV